MYIKRLKKIKDVSETIFYSKEDMSIIKKYKLQSKVSYSNRRFDDKVCLDEILKMCKKFKFKCFYCNEPLNQHTWQLDHFYAKAAGGKNKSENLVCSCKWCNQMKHALDGYAFIHKCQKIIDNNFFKQNNINIY